MGMQAARSASGIVYLFADRFVDYAPFADRELAYARRKARQEDLANTMLTVAFLQLASELCIQLDLVEYKLLRIITMRDVQVRRSGKPKGPLFGLEAAIWQSISDDPVQDRVRKIIARILGSRREDPWSDLVRRAKEGLSKQGFIVEDGEARGCGPDDAEWSANDQLVLQCEGDACEVKAMFESFRALNPALAMQLEKSVAEGISSMKHLYFFFLG